MRLVSGIEGVLPRVGAVSALRYGAVCEDMLHKRCRRQERNGGVEIGHIDMLPSPGLMTRVERQEDAHHPVHGRPAIVSDEVERDGWRLVRRANQVQHPTDSQIIEVVRWQVAIRAILAKAAERAIHQTRIDLAQCGVIRT